MSDGNQENQPRHLSMGQPSSSQNQSNWREQQDKGTRDDIHQKGQELQNAGTHERPEDTNHPTRHSSPVAACQNANLSPSQPLLSNKGDIPIEGSHDAPSNNSIPKETFDKEEDEYRPISSEDEMDRYSDDVDKWIDEEQHCELLVAAVNGATEQDNVLSSQNRSLSMRTSPRLTRSRASSNSYVLPKSKSPITFK
ncbi:hypothetical protein A4A49_02562 [Nicotiana attenuata]|uniref:Uncharacterized protein n=1 Tax=Nicotiana attenuata TaxID=49451 RepID=A0A1J6IGF7_NICAT|nr:hypothetical protein A4A49_02562 [Nicotiana attenuata]